MKPIEEDKVPRKNIVVCGDGGVGKTSLLFAYQNESLLPSYTPTIFAKTEVELTLDGRTYPINFHDTAGHDEFEKVRQVFYKTADAVVLCFSVGSRSSFVNIEHKWWRELQKPICRRRVPIILVATKSDLRKCSPSSEVVTTGEGIQLCNRINARAFLECSASTQTNIAEVIYESVRAAVRFSAAEEGIENLSDNEDSGGGEGSTDDHPSVVGFCLFHRQSGGNLRCNRRSFRHWFHKCL